MSLAADIARRMLGGAKKSVMGSREGAAVGARAAETRSKSVRASGTQPRHLPTRALPSPPIALPPLVLEAAPPPPPVLKPGWSTSCKAVNAATGRQCALLHGHSGAHRHGSTAFVTVALSDAEVARARARFDDAAQSRRLNPMST